MIAVPRCVFHACHNRGGRGASATITRLVGTRLGAALVGDWRHLWFDSMLTQDAVAPPIGTRSDAAKATEVQACLAVGAIGKALRQLDDAPRLPMTSLLIAFVRQPCPPLAEYAIRDLLV